MALLRTLRRGHSAVETIERLRSGGVRWLFVDDRYDRPDPRLDEFAALRYRQGDAAVYELS